MSRRIRSGLINNRVCSRTSSITICTRVVRVVGHSVGGTRATTALRSISGMVWVVGHRVRLAGITTAALRPADDGVYSVVFLSLVVPRRMVGVAGYSVGGTRRTTATLWPADDVQGSNLCNRLVST
jgi:hypothetical protein